MNIPAGQVVETEPGRGEKLKTGQTVKLTVSKGVETKMMPDVTGVKLNVAQNTLAGLGFKEPTVTYVPSDKPKDTVIFQSLEKDKEQPITAEITLEVSDGSQAPVYKDVTIDLKNSAISNGCRITITRDSKQVYSGTVPKGTLEVTLPNQLGVGKVTYHIVVNEMDGWDVTEEFSANG